MVAVKPVELLHSRVRHVRGWTGLGDEDVYVNQHEGAHRAQLDGFDHSSTIKKR